MQAAVMTSPKPRVSNSTSPATSISKPKLMSAIVIPRVHVSFSMPQRHAKSNRKRGTEDLHMV